MELLRTIFFEIVRQENFDEYKSSPFFENLSLF